MPIIYIIRYKDKVYYRNCFYIIQMESHDQLSDSAFIEQLQKGTLPAALFTHEAHLRLAFILINEFGVNKAIDKACFSIHNYTKILGAEDKYNKTITVAAIKAVNHFMMRSKSHNFVTFLNEFPQLKFNFKKLMAAHYSFDIYNSVKAKSTYLEPDLLAFD